MLLPLQRRLHFNSICREETEQMERSVHVFTAEGTKLNFGGSRSYRSGGIAP